MTSVFITLIKLLWFGGKRPNTALPVKYKDIYDLLVQPNTLRSVLARKHTHMLRISVLGAVGTGKTTFVWRLQDKQGEIPHTIGVDYHKLDMKDRDLRWSIMCWDCSSDVPYRDLVMQGHGSMSHSALVFYDASNLATLATATCIAADLAKTGVLITLVANKMDKESSQMRCLYETEETTPTRHGAALAAEKGYLFSSISATKDSTDVLQRVVFAMALHAKQWRDMGFFDARRSRFEVHKVFSH